MGSGPWPLVVVVGVSMVIYTTTMVQSAEEVANWCTEGLMSAGKLNETAMYMKKVYTESTNMTSRMARARNGTSTKNQTSDDICKLVKMGDQLLDRAQAEELYNCLAAKKGERAKRSIYNFDNLPNFKWSFPIRYRVTDDFTRDQKRAIEKAMDDWESKTCVTFREVASNEEPSHFVEFKKGAGCISFVGRVDTQPQPVFLNDDCFRYLVVTHEIGHVLGMWHTHQQPGRSDHITYSEQNVEPGEEGNFIEFPRQLIANLTGYNYASLMHYDPKDLSDIGRVVLRTKDPLYQMTIGQRVEVSHLDAKAINLAYCKDQCANSALSPDCQHGGYQDPRDCGVCICPDGWTGNTCQNLASSRGDTCGGELVASSTRKILTSPRYIIATGYPQTQECTWRIQTKASRPIKFRFIEKFGVFCTPNTQTCHDWVEIRYRPQHQLLAPRFCCEIRPIQTFEAETSDVMVIFRSRDMTSRANQRRGFRLEYFVDAVRCDPDLCRNGATCLPTGNTLCACAEGYTGRNCEIKEIEPCDVISCRNGGTCETLANGTSVCLCPPNYMGRLCEIRPSRCQSAPCQAGGTCLPAGSRICICPRNRTGVFCQTEVADPCDSTPCQNNGSCIPSSNRPGMFFCICPSGYRGFRCETAPQPSRCSGNPCGPNGRCTVITNGHRCFCNIGWTGASCEQTINPCSSQPCRNGGTCASRPGSRTFGCACPRGFMGRTCTQVEVTACTPSPCLNGGTCLVRGVSYFCLCTMGRGGTNCQQTTNACGSNPCTRGICMPLSGGRHRCMCSGLPCDGNTGVDTCTSRPCLNGGRCVPTIGSNNRTCTCARGFTGDSCQNRPNRCSPNPCRNGATCRVRGATYQCVCIPGQFGTNCQHGTCGACGAHIGQIREPCVQTRAAQTTCSRTQTYTTTTHTWIFFHKTVTRTRTVYYRCTRPVPQWSTARCCDRATMFFDRSGNRKCVVEGQPSFSSCSGQCGGCGTSSRPSYSVRVSRGRGSLVVSTQRQPCNTAVCRSCSLADRLACRCEVPCCPGFRQVGGQCVRIRAP